MFRHYCHLLHHIFNKVVKKTELHLELATKSRSYLKHQVSAAKNALESTYHSIGLPLPDIGSCIAPGTNKITMHFSFDFAQQVSNNHCYFPD